MGLLEQLPDSAELFNRSQFAQSTQVLTHFALRFPIRVWFIPSNVDMDTRPV